MELVKSKLSQDSDKNQFTQGKVVTTSRAGHSENQVFTLSELTSQHHQPGFPTETEPEEERVILIQSAPKALPYASSPGSSYL